MAVLRKDLAHTPTLHLPGSLFPLGELQTDLRHGIYQGPGVAVQAHAYFGCWFPEGTPDSATLVRGLDLLRSPAMEQLDLIPIYLEGERCRLAAWIRDDGIGLHYPDRILRFRFTTGCLVVAGQVLSGPGQDLRRWGDQVLQGEWRNLAGADGTYSCVAINLRHQHWVAAQDQFGLRPQYYLQSEQGVWFASSLKALAAISGLEPKLDGEHLINQVLRLSRLDHRSQLRGIMRPRGNSAHCVRPGQSPAQVYHAPGLFPWSGKLTRIPAETLVDDLNARLLERLQRLLNQPSLPPLALWLSGGLDSRWIAAALGYLGQSFSAYSVGGKRDADRRFAEQICQLENLPQVIGDLDNIEETLGVLPATNWWLDGSASLFHQLIGSAWSELESSAPFLLHGYFMDWLKWQVPRLAHLQTNWKTHRNELASIRFALARQLKGFGESARLELLAPGSLKRVDKAIAALIQPGSVSTFAESQALMATDGGPLEPFLTFGRLGYGLGGADFPLADSQLLSLCFEALRHPQLIRRRIQARCILSLDSKVGSVPAARLCLPTSALAGGITHIAGHMALHPSWLPKTLGEKRAGFTNPNPSRLRIVTSPRAVRWTRSILFRPSSQALETFGEGLSDFFNAVLREPYQWRAVSLLYGLVSRELFSLCWQRAAAGEVRPWTSNPYPGE